MTELQGGRCDESAHDNKLLLRPQTRRRVRHLDAQCPGTKAQQISRSTSSASHDRNVPLEDQDAVAAADVVRNFGREAFVVHEEKLNFPDVADQQLLQAIGEEVTGLIANRG